MGSRGMEEDVLNKGEMAAKSKIVHHISGLLILH
jgi:hypothetical protein